MIVRAGSPASSGRDHIAHQARRWVIAVYCGQKVKEMIGLHKDIVIGLQDKPGLVTAKLTDPLVAHHVFVSQVLAVVHEVSLNDVSVQITFK